MRLGARLNAVVVLVLACALATTAGVAGAETPSTGAGAEAAAKKKKCGKGKTRVKRKGRSSVCAKKCKAAFKHKVGTRGKVSCVRRKITTKRAPAPQPSTGPKAGNYSGTTAQNRPVTFTVEGAQVTNFQAGVNTFCSTPGNSRVVIDAIANIPPMAIGPDGSFSYKGTPDQGNPEIAGRITGGRATGTVGMNRGDSNYSGGQLTFGACAASGVTWNATG